MGTNGIAVAVYTMNRILLLVVWALVVAIPCQERGLQVLFYLFYSEAFSMGTVGGVVAREDFGVVMEKGREKCFFRLSEEKEGVHRIVSRTKGLDYLEGLIMSDGSFLF
ncbi:hypothetical protein Peur_044800 [Populus x canadensis]